MFFGIETASKLAYAGIRETFPAAIPMPKIVRQSFWRFLIVAAAIAATMPDAHAVPAGSPLDDFGNSVCLDLGKYIFVGGADSNHSCRVSPFFSRDALVLALMRIAIPLSRHRGRPAAGGVVLPVLAWRACLCCHVFVLPILVDSVAVTGCG